MNLSSPSTDLKELQKQNDLFRQLKLDHERQLKELTKGQDVNQLELRAKKALDDAKKEAATIIANAKRGVDQVAKSKTDYEALKAKLEASKVAIDEAKAAALKAKTDAEKLKAEAENLKAVLDKECTECDKLKAYLKSKTKELKEMLVRFDGSIN